MCVWGGGVHVHARVALGFSPGSTFPGQNVLHSLSCHHHPEPQQMMSTQQQPVCLGCCAGQGQTGVEDTETPTASSDISLLGHLFEYDRPLSTHDALVTGFHETGRGTGALQSGDIVWSLPLEDAQ